MEQTCPIPFTSCCLKLDQINQKAYPDERDGKSPGKHFCDKNRHHK